MAERTARMWCDECEDWRNCSSPTPNHVLHLLLSLVTFGFWLVVWFFMLFWSDFHCRECGSEAVLTAAAYEDRSRRRKRIADRQAKRENARSRARGPRSMEERIPPRPSALKETARAEWDAKYGKRGD